MRLFLLRSAEAANGKKDAKRKLNGNGMETAVQTGRRSQQKRTWEIAEIRHSHSFGPRKPPNGLKRWPGIKAKVREVPLLEPLADFRILADFIESAGENLLLVGHQPNLGRLGSYLLSRKSDVPLYSI